jgi:hypothetical protein
MPLVRITAEGADNWRAFGSAAAVKPFVAATLQLPSIFDNRGGYVLMSPLVRFFIVAGVSMEKPTRFAADNLPPFSPLDIQTMAWFCIL